MKSVVETLEPTKVKLTVEVDYEELKPSLDGIYKEIIDQVDIPGFRKGKVPPRIIDQRYGRRFAVDMLLDEVVPDYTRQAVLENEIYNMGEPDVEVKQVPVVRGSSGDPLIFEIKADFVPTFDLPNLVGLEVEVDAIEVTESKIDSELKKLQNSFAELVELDRSAEIGDYLILNMSINVDGKEVGNFVETSYELGAESQSSEMVDALIGVNSGNKVQFTTTLTEGEHKGCEAVFDVEVVSVNNRVLPEVDDEFAMLVSEHDTVEELREGIKVGIVEEMRDVQLVQARTLLLQKLVDNVDILLPEPVVEETIRDNQIGDLDEEALEVLRAEVEDELRKNVLLDILAWKRGTQITQDEMFHFVLQGAEEQGRDFTEVLEDNDYMRKLSVDFRRTKTIVSALLDVKVVDTAGEEIDVSKYVPDSVKNGNASQEESSAVSGSSDSLSSVEDAPVAIDLDAEDLLDADKIVDVDRV